MLLYWGDEQQQYDSEVPFLYVYVYEPPKEYLRSELIRAHCIRSVPVYVFQCFAIVRRRSRFSEIVQLCRVIGLWFPYVMSNRTQVLFFVHVKSYDKTGACVLAENEEF